MPGRVSAAGPHEHAATCGEPAVTTFIEAMAAAALSLRWHCTA